MKVLKYFKLEFTLYAILIIAASVFSFFDSIGLGIYTSVILILFVIYVYIVIYKPLYKKYTENDK